MPFSTKIIRLLNKVDEPLKEVLISILDEIEKQREETVTKKEFNELNDIVKNLSENLNNLTKRIEQLTFNINELTEFQKISEQKFDDFQKRTDENFNKVWQSIGELTEAQKKTEQRLDDFQKKTEENFNKVWQSISELTEAQKKTEEELKKLITEHKKTRENLGGLSHAIGYLLEDRAYKGLPELLKKDLNIEIIEPLRRKYIEIAPNKFIEINIIGKGKKENQEVWIFGECKTQLKKKDVDKFFKTLENLKYKFSGKKSAIFLTYQTSPKVEKYIKERGAKLYYSFELPNLT